MIASTHPPPVDLVRLVATFIAALVIGCVLASLQGCTPDARSPERATVRAAVVLVADGVRAVDSACASEARARADLALARACADAYTNARLALVGLAEGVDAWDEGRERDTTCALEHAANSLRAFVDLARTNGVALALVVDDALRFAPMIGGCRR